MSDYYKPHRTRNLFDPKSPEPFTVSRSGIDLFIQCPQCFYLDKRLGIGRPPGFPFSLNSAIDKLLKKEFDVHRAKGTRHPFMASYGLDAIPYAHKDLDAWRDSLRRGIQYLHTPTNLLVRGGIDDVWVNPEGELIIADYKATAKTAEVTLDAEWQDGYKRQMEIYQWLFRQNGFKVSPTGYFVYCNGDGDAEAFDAKLEFDVKLLPYRGDDSWVESALMKLKQCLLRDTIPLSETTCDFCAYAEARKEMEE